MRMWLLMWTWDDIQSGNGGLEEFLQATNRSTQSAAKWSSTDTHWFRYDMQPRFVPKNGCPTSGKTPFFIVVPQFSSLKLPCFFLGIPPFLLTYHLCCFKVNVPRILQHSLFPDGGIPERAYAPPLVISPWKPSIFPSFNPPIWSHIFWLWRIGNLGRLFQFDVIYVIYSHI